MAPSPNMHSIAQVVLAALLAMWAFVGWWVMVLENGKDNSELRHTTGLDWIIHYSPRWYKLLSLLLGLPLFVALALCLYHQL